MTMNLRRAISGGAFLLLTTVALGAAASDVADAVMRGDSAALRKLLTQKANVNAPQADGATMIETFETWLQPETGVIKAMLVMPEI